MDDPTLRPVMGDRAIDTATDVSRTITDVTEALQATVDRLVETINPRGSRASRFPPSAPLPAKRRWRACSWRSCSG